MRISDWSSDVCSSDLTKESRWYRFFSTSDNYDPDRLTFDRELLRRHYLDAGFADFRVVSAVAELTPDRKDFFVTYTVDEGERYKFGKLDVTSKIPELDAQTLRPLVEIESGGRSEERRVGKECVGRGRTRGGA